MNRYNRNSFRQSIHVSVGIQLASCLLFASGALAAPDAPFTLHDYLGHNWTNERVSFPLTQNELAHVQAGDALVDSDNKPVAYQLDNSDLAKPKVEFLADLAAFSSRDFSFTKSPATPQSDLKVEETGDTIRISNGKTGIALNKKPEPGQGPINSILLTSGKWIGSSRLATKLVPDDYTAKILSRGPVSIEAVCRQEFQGGGWWQLSFRLDANEPVVQVSETSNLKDGSATFSLSLSDNFDPDLLFYRAGNEGHGGLGANATANIRPGDMFLLEPWLHWWNRPTEGHAFSVYEDGGDDLLSIGAGYAATWVDPAIPATEQAPPSASLMKDDAGLHLDFVLRNGRREWTIAALDKDACLNVIKDPKLLNTASLPDQYQIKHGDFSLNAIKDYVLTWNSDSVRYPHMLVTPADVTAFRKNLKDPASYAAKLKLYQGMPDPFVYGPEGPLTAYFATGDAAMGKAIALQTILSIQRAVDGFLQQPGAPYGAAPHHSPILGQAPLMADAVLGQDNLDPAMKQRLLAQLAFLAYSIDRPDYWSPERGYAANPNMTTSVYGYKLAIACAIPTHPLAKAWIADAMKTMKNQIDTWSDDNGGWLEGPHYATVGYDQLLGAFLMTHNAGINDYLRDPKMVKVINWFGKISTPPDSRFAGFRHLPPVGNTYICEPTGEFGIVAKLWKDVDPKFSRQMQWMFHQQKSWPDAGIGGVYPALEGYRSLLLDPTIAEEAPAWQSEMFPNMGVVLRNKFPSDRETEMLLLQGSFGGWRSHYDDDSGSFTLWGKGRIIADDFGYYNPAIDNHNLLDAPTGRGSGMGIFNVQTFAPSPNFDYVAGSRGEWQRQIAFVKSADPLAPNYFLVNDTLHKPSPATWRLWLTADTVTTTPNGAQVSGAEDVDTDIFFLNTGKLDIGTETRTLKANDGIHPDGSVGIIHTTQIGLIAKSDGALPIVALIYPRLKTEKPPVVTSLANGYGAKVETAAGIDYVFLGAAPFSFDDGDIHFHGKVGAVQLRGSSIILSLGEAGGITARGDAITTPGPAIFKVFAK